MLEQIERIIMDGPSGAEPSRHDLKWLRTRAREVFSGVELKDKALLEIGSGTGLFCFYAASEGAQSALGLEPEADGSTSGTLTQFEAFRDATGATNVDTFYTDFQSYEPDGATFDVVLSYNSVNHLNEEACSRLRDDEASRDIYRGLFKKMRDLVRPGGTLIIWDVAGTNAWNALGVQNPMEPTLDWSVHQNPEVWTALLREVGFNEFKINWPTYHPVRALSPLLNNRACAYLTSSRFRLVVR